MAENLAASCRLKNDKEERTCVTPHSIIVSASRYSPTSSRGAEKGQVRSNESIPP